MIEVCVYPYFIVLSFLTRRDLQGLIWHYFPTLINYFFYSHLVGGCVGSVTGGMKIIRFLILFKMSSQELLRTLHPPDGYQC